MEVKELDMAGVKVIVPTYFDDNRGYSTEAYNWRTLREYGIETKFLVDYVCCNNKSGTIRGIHFQNNPHPQVKLVRVLQGAVQDYVVDLRKDSPTYKRWITRLLSAENREQIYLPSGYGHAYVTLVPNTIVQYKFDDYYDRGLVRAICWNDPEIGIRWMINDPVLSPNDERAPLLSESDVNLDMERNS